MFSTNWPESWLYQTGFGVSQLPVKEYPFYPVMPISHNAVLIMNQ